MGPQETYIETVFTCEGDFNDPNLPVRLKSLERKLTKLLLKEKEKLILKKVEPWNSVRVTFNIPKEAAVRLRQLAAHGDRTLLELGVLAVQIEGDEVISLTIAGKNNERTQLVFRTAGQSGSSSSNMFDMATSDSMNRAGPSGVESTRKNIAQYLRQQGSTAAAAAATSTATATASSSTSGTIFDSIFEPGGFKSPNTVVTRSDPIPFHHISQPAYTSPGRNTPFNNTPPGRSLTGYTSPTTSHNLPSPTTSQVQAGSPRLSTTVSQAPGSPPSPMAYPHQLNNLPRPSTDLSTSSPLLVNLLQMDLSGGHANHLPSVGKFPMQGPFPHFGEPPPKKKRRPRKPKDGQAKVATPTSVQGEVSIESIPNPLAELNPAALSTTGTLSTTASACIRTTTSASTSTLTSQSLPELVTVPGLSKLGKVPHQRTFPSERFEVFSEFSPEKMVNPYTGQLEPIERDSEGLIIDEKKRQFSERLAAGAGSFAAGHLHNWLPHDTRLYNRPSDLFSHNARKTGNTNVIPKSEASSGSQQSDLIPEARVSVDFVEENVSKTQGDTDAPNGEILQRTSVTDHNEGRKVGEEDSLSVPSVSTGVMNEQEGAQPVNTTEEKTLNPESPQQESSYENDPAENVSKEDDIRTKETVETPIVNKLENYEEHVKAKLKETIVNDVVGNVSPESGVGTENSEGSGVKLDTGRQSPNHPSGLTVNHNHDSELSSQSFDDHIQHDHSNSRPNHTGSVSSSDSSPHSSMESMHDPPVSESTIVADRRDVNIVTVNYALSTSPKPPDIEYNKLEKTLLKSHFDFSDDKKGFGSIEVQNAMDVFTDTKSLDILKKKELGMNFHSSEILPLKSEKIEMLTNSHSGENNNVMNCHTEIDSKRIDVDTASGTFKECEDQTTSREVPVELDTQSQEVNDTESESKVEPDSIRPVIDESPVPIGTAKEETFPVTDLPTTSEETQESALFVAEPSSSASEDKVEISKVPSEDMEEKSPEQGKMDMEEQPTAVETTKSPQIEENPLPCEAAEIKTEQNETNLNTSSPLVESMDVPIETSHTSHTDNASSVLEAESTDSISEDAGNDSEVKCALPIDSQSNTGNDEEKLDVCDSAMETNIPKEDAPVVGNDEIAVIPDCKDGELTNSEKETAIVEKEVTMLPSIGENENEVTDYNSSSIAHEDELRNDGKDEGESAGKPDIESTEVNATETPVNESTENIPMGIEENMASANEDTSAEISVVKDSVSEYQTEQATVVEETDKDGDVSDLSSPNIDQGVMDIGDTVNPPASVVTEDVMPINEGQQKDEPGDKDVSDMTPEAEVVEPSLPIQQLETKEINSSEIKDIPVEGEQKETNTVTESVLETEDVHIPTSENTNVVDSNQEEQPPGESGMNSAVNDIISKENLCTEEDVPLSHADTNTKEASPSPSKPPSKLRHKGISILKPMYDRDAEIRREAQIPSPEVCSFPPVSALPLESNQTENTEDVAEQLAPTQSPVDVKSFEIPAVESAEVDAQEKPQLPEPEVEPLSTTEMKLPPEAPPVCSSQHPAKSSSFSIDSILHEEKVTRTDGLPVSSSPVSLVAHQSRSPPSVTSVVTTHQSITSTHLTSSAFTKAPVPAAHKASPLASRSLLNTGGIAFAHNPSFLNFVQKSLHTAPSLLTSQAHTVTAPMFPYGLTESVQKLVPPMGAVEEGRTPIVKPLATLATAQPMQTHILGHPPSLVLPKTVPTRIIQQDGVSNMEMLARWSESHSPKSRRSPLELGALSPNATFPTPSPVQVSPLSPTASSHGQLTAQSKEQYQQSSPGQNCQQSPSPTPVQQLVGTVKSHHTVPVTQAVQVQRVPPSIGHSPGRLVQVPPVQMVKPFSVETSSKESVSHTVNTETSDHMYHKPELSSSESTSHEPEENEIQHKESEKQEEQTDAKQTDPSKGVKRKLEGCEENSSTKINKLDSEVKKENEPENNQAEEVLPENPPENEGSHSPSNECKEMEEQSSVRQENINENLSSEAKAEITPKADRVMQRKNRESVESNHSNGSLEKDGHRATRASKRESPVTRTTPVTRSTPRSRQKVETVNATTPVNNTEEGTNKSVRALRGKRKLEVSEEPSPEMTQNQMKKMKDENSENVLSEELLSSEDDNVSLNDLKMGNRRNARRKEPVSGNKAKNGPIQAETQKATLKLGRTAGKSVDIGTKTEADQLTRGTRTRSRAHKEAQVISDNQNEAEPLQKGKVKKEDISENGDGKKGPCRKNAKNKAEEKPGAKNKGLKNAPESSLEPAQKRTTRSTRSAKDQQDPPHLTGKRRR
ncbi:mucin-12 isoform X1 [Lingula anatina]|uniref:Mucin-12 isoform X1 n=1 Tax=Lingula anatina TaxID=7574 RepID=A0A1S3IM54_LINAN|nr:mucin-12 isoform X1 [Lingula anatina]|eukprot:XP_013399320.1 mucin-12 isoform X1 [Lingula anatina]